MTADQPKTSTRTRRRRWPLIVALPLLVAAGLSASSCAAPDLGAVDGRLRPCPSSPNCVGSQDPDESHRIAPLTFEGDATTAWAKARECVLAWPRTEILEEHDGYLRVVVASRWLRFRDDVELLLVRDAHEIHVRSASRVGHSDLGVNRERVERLRDAFTSD